MDDLRSLITAAAADDRYWALFVTHESRRVEMHTANWGPVFVTTVTDVDVAREAVSAWLLVERDVSCFEAWAAGLELVAACARCERQPSDMAPVATTQTQLEQVTRRS